MREFNLLAKYPQPEVRVIPERTIQDRILASYRGKDFFDGPRSSGYGGLLDDGRWKAVAEDIVKEYRPNRVLQFQSEKGYLLDELRTLGVTVIGVEPSSYARSHTQPHLLVMPNFPMEAFENPVDLAICIGVVYTLNLTQGMQLIRQLERMAHKAFITLASYETEEDLSLFRRWTLLGTTILKKEEWVEVLKHCGYTGDYWFVNAKNLKLREP